MRLINVIILLLLSSAVFAQRKQRVPITVVLTYQLEQTDLNRIRAELQKDLKKALGDSLKGMVTALPVNEVVLPTEGSGGKVFQLSGVPVRDHERIFTRDGRRLWKVTPDGKADYTITLNGKITLTTAQDFILVDYLKTN